MRWLNLVLWARLSSSLAVNISSDLNNSSMRIQYGGEFLRSGTQPPQSSEKFFNWIDLQIEALKQRSSLDSSQLSDYQARSERIGKLYEELDQIGRLS